MLFKNQAVTRSCDYNFVMEIKLYLTNQLEADELLGSLKDRVTANQGKISEKSGYPQALLRNLNGQRKTAENLLIEVKKQLSYKPVNTTENAWVHNTVHDCPLTVPVVVRHHPKGNYRVVGHMGPYENLADKEVIGVDCIAKIRQNNHDTRCIFHEKVEGCPAENGELGKIQRVYDIREFGHLFRLNNEEKD